MKKLAGFCLSLILLAGLTAPAQAATFSVDLWGGGEYEARTASGATIYDLPQAAIGLEFAGREFKFACNVTSGTINDYYTSYGYADLDTASIFLKGGHALINNKKVRLDLTAGFFNREINYDYLIYSSTLHDYVDTESYYSLTVGLDAKVRLDKRAWLDFSYSIGINPQAERTYYYSDDLPMDLAATSITSMKFNYLYSKNSGVALGYYRENIEYTLARNEDQYSGVTLGAFFRF